MHWFVSLKPLQFFSKSRHPTGTFGMGPKESIILSLIAENHIDTNKMDQVHSKFKLRKMQRQAQLIEETID